MQAASPRRSLDSRRAQAVRHEQQQLSSLSFHGPPETPNAVRRHDSWPSAAASAAASFGHRASGHGPLWAAGPTAAFDEALAFLPTEIPTSVTALHFEDGATSRAGVG